MVTTATVGVIDEENGTCEENLLPNSSNPTASNAASEAVTDVMVGDLLSKPFSFVAGNASK